MSDFERRLEDALGSGAESAPEAAGLAEGARRRLRIRRRRLTTIAAVVAVVAVALPVGILASEGDRPDRSDDEPVASVLDSQRVTCRGPMGTDMFAPRASWPVSAMDGGLGENLDETEVRAAFARVLEESPTDPSVPQPLRNLGADGVPYIVLATADEGYVLAPGLRGPSGPPRGGDGYLLGIGSWSTSGPGKDAGVAILDRQEDGSLRMTGWTDCAVEAAIPEGRSQVEIKAPKGGVDGETSEPVVVVNEVECTSGRNPAPFLGRPEVVEDDDRVLVTITSEKLEGGADCQGNPSVPVTLHLDEPIGDRELLDGGTWPPTPVKVAADDGWQTVEHEGVLVDIPGDWAPLETSSCEFKGYRFGPPGTNPCAYDGESLSLVGSATFDPSSGPEVYEDGEGGWSGYVYTSDWVVSVQTQDRDRAVRILASARLEGQEAPDLSAGWRTHRHLGLSVDVPASWKRGGLSAWCLDKPTDGWVEDPDSGIPMIQCGPPANWYGVRFDNGTTDEGSQWPSAMRQEGGQQYPEGAWVGHLTPKNADGYVTVVAPTQALAELILGSVRP